MKLTTRPAPFPWRSFAVLVLLATTAVACWAAWEMREQRDEMVRAWKGRP